MDSVRHLVEQHFKRYYDWKERILTEHITKKLGDDWTIEQLKGRVSAIRYRGAETTQYLLDGELLCQIADAPQPVIYPTPEGHNTYYQWWNKAKTT